ncbi:MAG: VTT domain-containing protein [Acidobacteriaceae bacterium]|nr:VTT domain-containing protein [Acidobacteriaceae bacterium]
MLIALGPLGLLFLSVIDSLGLPIVGGVDALLVTIASQRPAQAYFAAVYAIVGSIVGSLVLYGIARKGGEVLLAKHIGSRRGARLHIWFQRYGLFTVFIPAVSPIPLPMKVPVFCAGALQVRIGYFVAVVAVARVIRYFALAYLGQRFGRQTFQYLLGHWGLVVSIAAVLAIGAVVALRLVQRHEAALGHPE